MAAGLARLSHRDAARAAGLRLGALAGAGSGSAVPSELHLHALPRVVRLRRRLVRRYGQLQPVGHLPDAGARPAIERDRAPESNSVPDGGERIAGLGVGGRPSPGRLGAPPSSRAIYTATT